MLTCMRHWVVLLVNNSLVDSICTFSLSLSLSLCGWAELLLLQSLVYKVQKHTRKQSSAHKQQKMHNANNVESAESANSAVRCSTQTQLNWSQRRPAIRWNSWMLLWANFLTIILIKSLYQTLTYRFRYSLSALTLLAGLGDRKGIRPVKRWLLVCWGDDLTGALHVL